jgi:hypothetical protein
MRIRQRGMTFWGASFVIGVLGFFLLVGFQVFPAYLEDFKVKAALKSVIAGGNAGTMTHPEMIEALSKRFDIDNVTSVNPKQVKLEKRGRTRIIRMDYDTVIPLFFNVSILLDFTHVHEVPSVE